MSSTTDHFTGLAGLSGLMADGLVVTLRRFSELNARNLLTMQAELQSLEPRLKEATKLRKTELDKNPPKEDSDADSTIQGIPDFVEIENEILQEIRIKLREYNK
jgi:hypothetical protein